MNHLKTFSAAAQWIVPPRDITFGSLKTVEDVRAEIEKRAEERMAVSRHDYYALSDRAAAYAQGTELYQLLFLITK